MVGVGDFAPRSFFQLRLGSELDSPTSAASKATLSKSLGKSLAKKFNLPKKSPKENDGVLRYTNGKVPEEYELVSAEELARIEKEAAETEAKVNKIKKEKA